MAVTPKILWVRWLWQHKLHFLTVLDTGNLDFQRVRSDREFSACRWRSFVFPQGEVLPLWEEHWSRHNKAPFMSWPHLNLMTSHSLMRSQGPKHSRFGGHRSDHSTVVTGQNQNFHSKWGLTLPPANGQSFCTWMLHAGLLESPCARVLVMHAGFTLYPASTLLGSCNH